VAREDAYTNAGYTLNSRWQVKGSPAYTVIYDIADPWSLLLGNSFRARLEDHGSKSWYACHVKKLFHPGLRYFLLQV
jgi:hypothetical protein